MATVVVRADQIPTPTQAEIEAIRAQAQVCEERNAREGYVDPDCPPMTQAELDAAKRQMLSLRLPLTDLVAIRAEAKRLGIPYQTLIGSIIHRFVTGELVDRKTA